MDTTGRMLDDRHEPTAAQVSNWIGTKNYKRWLVLREFIERHYPKVFEQKWLYGGKKYGWTLRYKKSKSFCTLIPERGKFLLLLVFGTEERTKVEEILSTLGSHFRQDYEKSTTYHDGRWVVTCVDSAKVLTDIERLLFLKRRPTVAPED